MYVRKNFFLPSLKIRKIYEEERFIFLDLCNVFIHKMSIFFSFIFEEIHFILKYHFLRYKKIF